jgi:hypothetical protein
MNLRSRKNKIGECFICERKIDDLWVKTTIPCLIRVKDKYHYTTISFGCQISTKKSHKKFNRYYICDVNICYNCISKRYHTIQNMGKAKTFFIPKTRRITISVAGNHIYW